MTPGGPWAKPLVWRSEGSSPPEAESNLKTLRSGFVRLVFSDISSITAYLLYTVTTLMQKYNWSVKQVSHFEVQMEGLSVALRVA